MLRLRAGRRRCQDAAVHPRRASHAARDLALLAVLLLVPAGAAFAHPAPFSYIDVRIAGGGVHGRIVLHDLDVAHDLGLTSAEALATDAGVRERAEAIIALMTPRFSVTLDGEPAGWQATALRALPERSSIEIVWRSREVVPGRLEVGAAIFPYDPNHQTFLNVYEGGALVRQEVLEP